MFLYIILLGFFVSFLLLINSRKSHPANIFLFFFLLINNLYLLVHYALVFSKNLLLISVVFVHFTPLFYLLGPFIYFYVRGIINDKSEFKKSDLIHFIPSFLFLLNTFPYTFLSWHEKVKIANQILIEPTNFLNVRYLFLPPLYSFTLRPLFSIGYFLYSFYILKTSKVLKNIKNDTQARIVRNWLHLLLTTVFVVYFCYFIFSIITLFSKTYVQLNENAWHLIMIMFFGILIINTILFFFPSILYGYPRFESPLTKDVLKKQINSFEISDDRIQLLDQKLEQYLLDKPYLQKKFTLSRISIDLNIPAHHLTYYFNEHLGVSFNIWKNDLRIEYVIDIFNKGERKEITLEALSKEVGFSSRSNFIESFKSKTGKTPSEWLNSN